MNKFFLYEIKNNVNGKCYIGWTCKNPPEKRWGVHKNSAISGKRMLVVNVAMRKHGIENFVFTPLISFDSKVDVCDAEIFMIDACGTRYPDGYNIHRGGCGGREKGFKHSHETKQKISAKHVGNVSFAKNFKNKGKPSWNSGVIGVTDDTRIKMRLAKLGKVSSRKGVTLSTEIKSKMSIAHRKPWSDAQYKARGLNRKVKLNDM